MQPNSNVSVHSDMLPKGTIMRVAKKEVALFFASPVAYLFLATFAAITLFIFFWGESFFARNISDVRPLFEWMPLLLVFLCATLTMRLWSDERRSGTLEYILTQAVPLWHFVAGKFLGCMFLLAVALVLTLPLPITVAYIGDLDWGPVFAGYIAAILLGAAYLSIGLFASARTDSQIVSLISACALSGLLYLVGTSSITSFAGNQFGEWLRLLGTGSRFESITRGVIDMRDLYYYISIAGVFLVLNTYVLERERWATDGVKPRHKQWVAATALLALNALGANIWLNQINVLRMDVTHGNQYSISESTKGYLNQLQEPLLVRGYFSAKTHPLLAPLVPQMRDLIKEYQVAGNGKVRIEFVDPMAEPELEKEANQKFGIQPVPFQVADRYQSSIVSSYFDVLVQYGDEYQVLGFGDLIEVQARSESDINVQLRNPEHDLTRAIKKVLHSYQAGGNLFDTVKSNLMFNAYLSADEKLPSQLAEFKQQVTSVLDSTKAQADGRLKVNVIDPDSNAEIAKRIGDDYGFMPMATSLFSNERFYFYMTLSNGEQVVQIPIDDMTQASFERNLEAGIKRFATGFTKTVALVTPSNAPASPYMGYGQGGARFSRLEAFIGSELNVISEDLSDGAVSGEADILVLAAPKELNEKQVFAVDQFLMKGGTVIAATSPFSANLSNRSLSMQKHTSGLEDWLAHYGLSVDDELVLDPQNTAFPVPVSRNVGGFQLQEIRMLDYPYFVDVRGEGLNGDNLISAELPQLTVPWASPIVVNQEKQNERTVTELLRSSNKSWVSQSLSVVPQVSANGVSGFTPSTQRDSFALGVLSEGRFDSYFVGKNSPLLESKPEAETENASQEDTASEAEEAFQFSGVIERSPETARIILVSSNDFLRDEVLQLVSNAQRTEYLNPLQFAANAVEWSLEDAGLLSIRSRGHFNRTLPAMEQSTQVFWEYFNYGLAAFALALLAFGARRARQVKQRQYVKLLAN